MPQRNQIKNYLNLAPYGKIKMSLEKADKQQLSSLVLKGFKSIQDSKIEFKKINVFIGANGAGKSNLVSFFVLLNALIAKQLSSYIARSGSPDALLYHGRKRTPQFSTELYFGRNGYKFSLEATADNRMFFVDERLWWNSTGDVPLGSGYYETKIYDLTKQSEKNIAQYVIKALQNWRVYHFHDTSKDSKIKQVSNISTNDYFRANASNLAAFLFLIKHEHKASYERIVKTIGLVFPFFEDFNLRPMGEAKSEIQLEWKEKDSDEIFLGHQLSDGTLRFICLCALLLQPHEFMPQTIIIDEPELGLHPYAIKVLAGMLKSIAVDRQVIISTQSVDLLDEFSPDDVIVVDRKDNQSCFRRLEPGELDSWIDDYSLGQIWKKNLIGGRP